MTSESAESGGFSALGTSNLGGLRTVAIGSAEGTGKEVETASELSASSFEQAVV
jgi:hypothetical protein